MSSLSEQERIGLEEVFLSISSSRNWREKWFSWRNTFSIDFITDTSGSPLSFRKQPKNWLENGLKNHKITKLFAKIEKRRKF